MSHYRKKHPSRNWRGCAMCKWYKRKGQHPQYHSHFGDARRELSANEQLKAA